jgi:hypothetical protein
MKRRRKECRDLNIPLTSILMRRRCWREECHDFDISSCSAASSEHTNREIGDGGAAMRCTSCNTIGRCGNGMHRLR